MKSAQGLDIQGKTVLLRCDLNVPADRGIIQDDFRIASSVPTIRYITERGGRCIILSHFGRPTPEHHDEFTLAPIAQRLEGLLGKEVRFLQEPIGEGAQKQIAQMRAGEVVLLENIRFYAGEEKNDPKFAKQLASLGDLYVNDAFGACHRAHASIAGIPKYLPSVAGLLLEKEIAVLGKVRDNPEKPLVVAVGGAKAESKAGFLKAISKNAKAILLGDLLTIEVQEKGIDVSSATELVYAFDGVDGTFDLGAATIEKFKEKINTAKTVFWAGPLGKIEEEKYTKGSIAIAKAIIESGAYAVAGGGDLSAFLRQQGFADQFDHVSTGGGAMLAFLSGEELPGLKALEGA